MFRIVALNVLSRSLYRAESRGAHLGEQHNGSVVRLRFSFAQVMRITQVLNERAIVSNGRLYLLEAHIQSMPCLAQTGNMLRQLALNLLDLPFECHDSLVCLSGELLGRLQKQLAQLAFIQVELLHQLQVFPLEPAGDLRRSNPVRCLCSVGRLRLSQSRFPLE